MNQRLEQIRICDSSSKSHLGNKLLLIRVHDSDGVMGAERQEAGGERLCTEQLNPLFDIGVVPNIHHVDARFNRTVRAKQENTQTSEGKLASKTTITTEAVLQCSYKFWGREIAHLIR
jgi:hypothetical protein